VSNAPVSAFQNLKEALRADNSYAWAWHCNLAMPIMDSTGCSAEAANAAGAHLMRHIFDIDVTKFTEWANNGA
jgi:hypothetical protein